MTGPNGVSRIARSAFVDVQPQLRPRVADVNDVHVRRREPGSSSWASASLDGQRR